MTLDMSDAYSGAYQPSKRMWWHDAIIDLMLSHPDWSKKQIAHALGKSAVFIYMITNSDLFNARYAKRREEYERQLGVGLAAKVTQVANRTLDRILTQLNDEGKNIPLNHLESLADKTLSRLGYGPKIQPPSTVNIQAGDRAQVVVIPAARADLDAARALIREREALLAIGNETEGRLPSFGNETQGSGISEEDRAVAIDAPSIGDETISSPSIEDL